MLLLLAIALRLSPLLLLLCQSSFALVLVVIEDARALKLRRWHLLSADSRA
jgi:hypothetical protein